MATVRDRLIAHHEDQLSKLVGANFLGAGARCLFHSNEIRRLRIDPDSPAKIAAHRRLADLHRPTERGMNYGPEGGDADPDL